MILGASVDTFLSVRPCVCLSVCFMSVYALYATVLVTQTFQSLFIRLPCGMTQKGVTDVLTVIKAK